jgi:hypothetical protein
MRNAERLGHAAYSKTLVKPASGSDGGAKTPVVNGLIEAMNRFAPPKSTSDAEHGDIILPPDVD